MNISMKIICLFSIFVFFTYCNKPKTYNEISETNEDIEQNEIMTNTYTKNSENFQQKVETEYSRRKVKFNGPRFENRSPNIFNNVFSEFMKNTNYITIDDPEYKIEKLYLDGNFSPIGWSKNGHFAYARFNDDYISSVTIFNIITDDISEQIENVKDYMEYRESLENIYGKPYDRDYETYELVEDLKSNYKISFEDFWEKYNNDIIELLKKYEMISFSDFELFNINTLSERYNFEIIIEDGLPKEEYRMWNEPRIEQGKNIIIKNADGKRKIIGEVGMLHFGFKGQEYDWGYYSVLDFAGYYEFPFEERIIIYFYDRVFIPITAPLGGKILEYVVRKNFEGVVGCHLINSFE
jgi:hypothetical protein